MQSLEIERVVRVAVPTRSSLGSLMGDMREWFDYQGIQPIEFRSITLDSGIAFDLNFRHPHHADLFRAAFA